MYAAHSVHRVHIAEVRPRPITQFAVKTWIHRIVQHHVCAGSGAGTGSESVAVTLLWKHFLVGRGHVDHILEHGLDHLAEACHLLPPLSRCPTQGGGKASVVDADLALHPLDEGFARAEFVRPRLAEELEAVMDIGRTCALLHDVRRRRLVAEPQVVPHRLVNAVLYAECLLQLVQPALGSVAAQLGAEKGAKKDRLVPGKPLCPVSALLRSADRNRDTAQHLRPAQIDSRPHNRRVAQLRQQLLDVQPRDIEVRSGLGQHERASRQRPNHPPETAQHTHPLIRSRRSVTAAASCTE
jgi:hypothetical protein